MKRIGNDRGQAAVITVSCSWRRSSAPLQWCSTSAPGSASSATPRRTPTRRRWPPRTSCRRAPAPPAGSPPSSSARTEAAPRPSRSLESLANDTVTVKVTREAPGVFSKLFGINSVSVHAQATARAGNPDEANYAAPIAVDIKHPCFSASRSRASTRDHARPREGRTGRVPPAQPRPIPRRHRRQDRRRNGSCKATTATCRSAGTDPIPGAAFNDSKIKSALTVRIGDELLFPVYDKTRENGSGFDYHVIGWVGFVVTSFDAQRKSRHSVRAFCSFDLGRNSIYIGRRRGLRRARNRTRRINTKKEGSRRS